MIYYIAIDKYWRALDHSLTFSMLISSYQVLVLLGTSKLRLAPHPTGCMPRFKVADSHLRTKGK
jgi:hypothetical protein